jgi:cytosine/adenosine deaminase-related metal-dependent hydrolase
VVGGLSGARITGELQPEEEVFKYRYAFTQLIRNGITTAMPITSMYYRQWAETYDEFAAVAGVASELGLRTYLGPCYMSGMSYWQADGTLAHHWDEARAWPDSMRRTVLP